MASDTSRPVILIFIAHYLPGFNAGGPVRSVANLAESIYGRMARRGGTAAVSTAPGEGTKVSLRMPRIAAQPAGRT